MLKYTLLALLYICFNVNSQRVDYSGHKILSVLPKTLEELEILRRLRNDYSVDLWNEPNIVNSSVMMRLQPNLQEAVTELFVKRRIEHSVAFHDLQKVIDEELLQHAPTKGTQKNVVFDFGRYHQLDEVNAFISQIAQANPNLVKIEVAGNSYENRPIYMLRITAGTGAGTKPAIMLECGIHAREWSSVAAGLYFINYLVSNYKKDNIVTHLVDTYEFYIIPEANPDGYLFTWTQDRLWRKTRSRSNVDWLGNCRGADANRNFDIQHCGVGASRKPCEEIYCGDAPFSESESRTLRDLMIRLKSRMKGYYSLHAFSQFWMTPYGITKQLPANYAELARISNIGVNAIRRRYGTAYRVGSIANIIYESAGSSVDYAYEVQGIKLGFALELPDQGRFGFFLPQQMILPMCEETTDGLIAAMNAM